MGVNGIVKHMLQALKKNLQECRDTNNKIIAILIHSLQSLSIHIQVYGHHNRDILGSCLMQTANEFLANSSQGITWGQGGLPYGKGYKSYFT